MDLEPSSRIKLAKCLKRYPRAPEGKNERISLARDSEIVTNTLQVKNLKKQYTDFDVASERLG